MDNDEVIGALLSAVKNDNSIVSSSFALLAAAQLSKPNLTNLLKSVDIEVSNGFLKLLLLIGFDCEFEIVHAFEKSYCYFVLEYVGTAWRFEA